MAKRSPLFPLELWVIHTAQPWTRLRYKDDSKDTDIEKTAGLGCSCGVGHGVINTSSKVNNYNITDLVTVSKPASWYKNYTAPDARGEEGRWQQEETT